MHACSLTICLEIEGGGCVCVKPKPLSKTPFLFTGCQWKPGLSAGGGAGGWKCSCTLSLGWPLHAKGVASTCSFLW